MKSFKKYIFITNKKEQFYKVIRPTVLLLGFWGFFPFSNSFHGNGKNLSFKMCNIQLIIKLFFYGMNGVLLILCATIRMDIYSRIVNGCLMMILIIVSYFTDKYLVETIQSIEEYDLYYNKSKNVTVYLRYRFRGIIWFIFNFIISFLRLDVIILILNIKKLNIQKFVINLNDTITEGPWHILFGGIYIQFCYEIALRFLELRKSLEKILLKYNFEENDIVLEEIRILHGKLTNITEVFNSVFGLRLALYLLKLILLFLFKVYIFVFNNVPFTWYSLYSELFKFIIAFFISYCSELMLYQNRKILEFLNSIPQSKINFRSKFQLFLLTRQAGSESLAITAWGMFKVDREMFATLFVVVITYIITVLQIPADINTYILAETENIIHLNF